MPVNEEAITTGALEATSGMVDVVGYCITVIVFVDVGFPHGRDPEGPLVKLPLESTHGSGFDSMVGAIGALFRWCCRSWRRSAGIADPSCAVSTARTMDLKKCILELAGGILISIGIKMCSPLVQIDKDMVD